MKRFLRQLGLSVAAAATLFVLVFGGGYLIIEHDGNFHPVEPGVVFRSAQLDAEQLRTAVSSNGIRSILNLRGPNPGRDWYDQEMFVSRERGVVHFDYAISANSPLPMERMRAILDIIDKAPKPILIHCQAGADRTGLVSALYLATHGHTPAQAREQLSVQFGHVPFGTWSSTRAMDDSLELLLQHGSTVH